MGRINGRLFLYPQVHISFRTVVPDENVNDNFLLDARGINIRKNMPHNIFPPPPYRILELNK